jgi:hypothetical protein
MVDWPQTHTDKHRPEVCDSPCGSVLVEVFGQIDDHRHAGKVDFSLHDCLMSALAMMFFQDPSLLCFQRRMQERMQCSNLKNMFEVGAIPSDAALRKTVDPIDTENINPCFAILFQHLQRDKQLLPYKLDSGHYLIALDGSQYFSSETINCPSCLTYKGAKSKLRYSHQVLQAVMLHPTMRQVIPLAPEMIINSDGDTKNDCERSAGKRLIGKIRAGHPKLKIMVTCDGLYSNQSFIDVLKAHGMSFVLVAKPTDHKLLFQHQILELCDRGYQYCRSKFSSRKEYWNNLRIVIRVMLFTDFDHLLRNVADPPEVRAPG